MVAAAGLGTCLGSVAGNRLRDRAPEGMALSCLAAGTVMCAATALFWSAWAAVAMGLVAGLTSSWASWLPMR